MLNPQLGLNDLLVLLEENRIYHGIPEPQDNVPALVQNARSMKEMIEILTRQRGSIEDSAVLVGEFLAILKTLNDRLDLLERIIIELVPAGYGQMSGQDVVVGANIPATWTTMTYFDQSSIPKRGVTVNLTNDSFTFDVGGLWLFNININLEVTPQGSSRSFDVRLYNATAATPAPFDWLIATGSNSAAVNFSGNILVDITEAQLGDEFVLQWQSGDNINAVAFPLILMGAVHVGELKSLIV